MQTQFKSLVSI